MFIALSSLGLEVNGQTLSDSEAVVSKYLKHLETGDIGSLDALFFRIPLMESNKEDWLELLGHVVSKVKNERLAWEVVCSKELTETAAVIVNQTMKHGQAHADPDAIFLVKKNGDWLLLPDTIAYNARKEVQKAMSNAQIVDRHILKGWVIKEIRGLTSDCS